MSYDLDAARLEIERLRGALECLKSAAGDSNDCQYGTLSASWVKDIASEALAAQQEKA